MKYDWLWFDLDNTLLNFNASSKVAFSKLLEDIAVPENEDSYANYHAINAVAWKEFEDGVISQEKLKRERFKRYLDTLNVDFDGYEANAIYLNHIAENSFFVDGALGLLEFFANAKMNMAILTNGMKEVQRPRLINTEIINYFEAIIVSDEIGCSKPELSFFDHAYDECGKPDYRRVLMIGDSLGSDILGAINFGVDCCWMNPTEAKNENNLPITHTISSLDQLKKIVF